jgi:hypothetical protein
MDTEFKRALQQIDLCRKAGNDTEMLLKKIDNSNECGLYIDDIMLKVGKRTMLILLQERMKLLKMYQNELNNFIRQK